MKRARRTGAIATAPRARFWIARGAVVALAIGAWTSGPADVRAEGSFAVLSPPAPYETIQPDAISADGSAVLGWATSRGEGARSDLAVLGVDGAFHVIGPPQGFDRTSAPLGLSADGSLAYFRAYRLDEQGKDEFTTARWTPAEGSIDISSTIGDESFHPFLLSPDGRTLVGQVGPFVQNGSGQMVGYLAFWSETSGLRVIDDVDAVRPGWPTAVSRDGSATGGAFFDPSTESYGEFVVHRSGRTRSVWSPDFPLGWQAAGGLALSSDGESAYGIAWRDASSTRFCLYVWPTNGEPTCLGEMDAPPGNGLWVSTPSQDDSRVLVHVRGLGAVWDEAGGLRDLGHFLEAEQGLDLGDLSGARMSGSRLSADGRVIVGLAWIDSATIPWRAILAPRCADGFDNDGDGAVDFPDDPGCASADDPDDAVRDDAVIDVEPGRDPNTLVIGRPGIVTVAILGSNTFHVADVDGSTLRLGAGEARPMIDLDGPERRARRTLDVNRDGHDDLLVPFATGLLSLTLEDRSVCLQGTAASDAFEACDDIVPVLGRFGCGEGFALAFLAPVAVRLGRRRRAPQG